MNFVAKVLAAAPPAPDLKIGKPDDVKITNVGTLVKGAISGALIIAAILVFAYLLWGGIQWITSGGDKAKTQEARDRITAAIVGLVVVAAAWAIMLLIQYFFGISILDDTITPPKGY